MSLSEDLEVKKSFWMIGMSPECNHKHPNKRHRQKKGPEKRPCEDRLHMKGLQANE
jgi:hypothetical protein